MVAIVLVDVKRFRVISETLGQNGGDELLRQISSRIETKLKSTQFANPARIGMDCFGVMISTAGDINELAHFVEQGIKAFFEDAFVVEDQEVRLSARAGIAVFPNDGNTSETLLRNAETALRNAKRSGERLVFYAAEMTAQVAQRLALETKLRKALEHEQFVLHYQPKFELAGGRLRGLEALIRWQDTDIGLVSPASFIPLLEETGLIVEVGDWVLRRALTDYRKWIECGYTVPHIAVNVSATQLKQNNFVDLVANAVEQSGVLPDVVEFEITENMMMQDVQAGIRKLSVLRERGFHIAMDDFGTGNSSLSHIARMPIDSVKIDRTFISNMMSSAHDKSIASAIIALARTLDLRVVAEGVETEEQRALLLDLGCNDAQGYLFSKPLAAADISKAFMACENLIAVTPV